MPEEYLPGGDWRARVTEHTGTEHDTPVLCWVRTPEGMGPVILLPRDTCATAFIAEPTSQFLRAREITSVRLYHPDVLASRRPELPPGPGSYTLDSQPLPDTGPR